MDHASGYSENWWESVCFCFIFTLIQIMVLVMHYGGHHHRPILLCPCRHASSYLPTSLIIASVFLFLVAVLISGVGWYCVGFLGLAGGYMDQWINHSVWSEGGRQALLAFCRVGGRGYWVWCGMWYNYRRRMMEMKSF